MTTWTQEQTPRPPATQFSVGDATLYVHPRNDDGEIWQSIIVATGEHSKRSYSDCQHYWPKEAAALLRQIADRIERECDA